MTPVQHVISRMEPGTFDHHLHWYPKARNAELHPLVHKFLTLDNQVIAERYRQIHPTVRLSRLMAILNYQPEYYRWAGADLIYVTNASGKRRMILIENNSCPSGQKSIPLSPDLPAHGGYQVLLENSFMPFCKSADVAREEVLAVFYDKNIMETSGYAAALADLVQRPVYLVPFFDGETNGHIRMRKGYIQIETNEGHWKNVNAAFRYVTQRPWNRIPVKTLTRVYNPVITCLAGGRNKLMASKAYDDYNSVIKRFGLKIQTPETIQDVTLDKVPYWVKRFGDQAVVKEPYSNAGQGVHTILNESELNAFMSRRYTYTRFIVQSLIGHYAWRDSHSSKRHFHLGTLPDAQGSSYVFDLRMMIAATPGGFRPVSLYSRKARSPLTRDLDPHHASWDMLGTNLSHLDAHGEWTTDSRRLIIMDKKEFSGLGLGWDELIEAYVQSVLSTVAIDRMAKRLINRKGELRMKLFSSLNDDPVLINEILKS